MSKVNTKLEVLCEKISDKHNDSFWYDGVIAVKGDYRLIACGEIRFYYRDSKGNYLGMYDVKARDDFPNVKDDNDLADMYASENGFECVNNNWFEILNNDNESFGDIYDNYDDALKALKEMK